MKKKNVIMRVASVLGLAVLLTTCAISGTFAKYTTSDSNSDTPRVAKFGVTVTANGEMFATSYANEESIGTTAVGEGSSVLSSDSDKLVAPGTKGTLANAKITGTPEVAVRVSYDATLTLDGWTVDSAEYCPLIIKVGNETYGLTGMEDSAGSSATQIATDIADLKSKVETAIENYSADYAAGTNLSEIGATGYVSVSWEWAFDVSEENDVKDTKLGNATTPATITLAITTTVTQIN